MSGMQHIPDPYRVLGVQRAATLPQIKAAHRGLAKRFHPDAPEGDTGRFLAVQEAYLLLSDPDRRRDWDARHAPGPVRAGEGTTRGRGRAAAGRWTREDPGVGTRRPARPARRGPAGEGGASRGPGPGPSRGAGEGSRDYDAPDDAPHDPDEPRDGPRRWSASGRDPSTRSYTWSAEGVPWWEDFPGPGRAERGSETSGRGGRPAASDRADGDSTRAPKGRGGPPLTGPGRTGSPSGDPDVYSRSSGAAWSSAARRYFRQADSDLPSRGVFRREGTQFVTGARARTAADTDARRTAPRPAAPPRASNVPHPASPEPASERPREPERPRPSARERARTTSEGVLRPRPGPLGPRQAFHHEPPAGPTGSPAAATADALPNASRRGVLTGRVTSVTSTDLRPGGVRTGSIGSSTIARRVAELSLAWLPITAGIGYGAPAAIGCSGPEATCPEPLPSFQALLAVLVLAMFVAFPAVARIAALATVAALSVAVPLLVVGALLGLVPPARPIAVAAISLVGLAYLVGATAATWVAARSSVWRRTQEP